jgi:uncharacterized membrane protein
MSEAATRPGRSIWLVISLCLNVVLITMIVMGTIRAMERQRVATLGRAFSPQSILAHLPADRAAKIQAVIDAHAERLGILADDSQRARLNARRFFTADRLDVDAYARAQAGMRAADDAFQAERHAQMLEIARLLTPKERREIADRARNEKTPQTHSRH